MQSNVDNLRCIAISLPGVLGYNVVWGVAGDSSPQTKVMVYAILQYSTFSLSCSSSSSLARRSSSRRSNILERILQLVVLAHVVLSPPLGCDVLHHHLAHVGLHEATDEPRIPELGGDSQVFAAAHEGVGLAALGRGGDAVGVEVLLFAAGEGDEAGVN